MVVWLLHTTPLMKGVPLVSTFFISLSTLTTLMTVLMATLTTVAALAQPPVTSYTYQGVPSQEELVGWQGKIQSNSSLLLQTQTLDGDALDRLEMLPEFTGLQLTVDKAPEKPYLEKWKRLTTRFPVTLVLQTGNIPSLETIDHINELDFVNVLLRLSEMPPTSEAARVNRFNAPVGIDFTHGAYPLYVEKQNLSKIPSDAILTYYPAKWPKFSQMDVLNMLPHPHRIQMINAGFPSPEEYEMLLQINRLTHIRFQTDQDEPVRDDWSEKWKSFETIHVTWTTNGFIPKAGSLKHFENSCQESCEERRSIEIHISDSLTPEQETYLRHSKLPVTLIRPIPQ